MKKSMITILVALMIGHSWVTIAYTVRNDIAFNPGFTSVVFYHSKEDEAGEGLGWQSERVNITKKDATVEFGEFDADMFPKFSPRITGDHRGSKTVIMFSEVQKTLGHTAFAYTVFTQVLQFKFSLTLA
jgi:hypothetical protein